MVFSLSTSNLRPRSACLWLRLAFTLALGGGLVSPGHAQTPPDAGSVLRDSRLPQVLAPQTRSDTLPITAPPAVSTSASSPAPALADVRTKVTQFDFVGNSALSQDTLRRAVANWTGRALSFGELIEAVDAVEARYKVDGYFLAQGSLPPQSIRDGAVQIVVSEGMLNEARLEGESLVLSDVVYRYLDVLPKGQALRLAELERQILLINDLAGMRSKMDLQAGDVPGSTDIIIAQALGPVVDGRIDMDNHGSSATGENRLGLTVNANSLFAAGERLTLNTTTTADTQGLLAYSLRGELPVGADGWKLLATASRASYTLGNAFQYLDASGSADGLRLALAYPVVRGRTANLRLQIDADHNDLADHIRASQLELEKRSQGLSLTSSGDWINEAAGRLGRFDLVLRSGQLTLESAAAAADAAPDGPETAGGFSKALFSGFVQQSLGGKLGAYSQITLQAADKNLDSSEKFSVGGPSSMPGYASGEASGDSGAQFKVGLRWLAFDNASLSAYYDYAKLKILQNPLASATSSNERVLSNIGVGADWSMGKGLVLSTMIAWPGKPTNNASDDNKPRGWISLASTW